MERHRFDTLSFAFGVVYALIGLTFLLPASPFDLAPLIAVSARWVWPLVIVGLGIAIIVPLLKRNAADQEDEPA